MPDYTDFVHYLEGRWITSAFSTYSPYTLMWGVRVDFDF